MPDKEKNIKQDKQVIPKPDKSGKLIKEGAITPIKDTIDISKPPKESADSSKKSDKK
jgi:hypothetical protein